jgi:phospholipase/carboxylesterase
MNANPENPHAREAALHYGANLADAAVAVVLLHGRNQGPETTRELAERIALPAVGYLAPVAAGRSWYPAGFMAATEANQPSLDCALERVDLAVAELEAAGFSASKIALVGFSQGACLASEYFYRNPDRCGALVAFTGGLIGPPGTSWRSEARLDGVPVLLASSDIDEWVPVERVYETAAVFRGLGAAVDERIYPAMAHTVSDDEILAARELLLKLAG